MQDDHQTNHHEEEEQPEREEQDQAAGQEENIDYKESYLRALADYQNLQHEMAEKQSEYARYANENLLKDLLPVVEHFHQGVKYIPEEYQKEDWMVGFLQIKKMLEEFMRNQGVERIETVGRKFDPEIHEAVGNKAADDEYPAGTIIEEVTGGYKLNGKIIQSPKVIVAE